MKLSEITGGRENNLDIIRFCAAALVILCHAFPVSLGEGHVDILGRITDDQIHFGNLAVCIFFFYGGFLISKSAERLQGAGPYFKARLLRIIPCLAAVTFGLTFLAGPILTKLSPGEYFTDAGTFKYLLNSVMVLVHELPGVFQDNIYNPTVNGPLWTLPVEFLCYIMCFLAWKLHFLNEKNARWMILLFAAGYLGAVKLLAGSGVLSAALRPVGLFFAGMIYYIYREKIVIRPWLAGVCAVFLAAAARVHFLEPVIFFCLPYLLAWLGFGTKHKFSGFARRGEVSYGMYLLGWPIQQMICQVFGGRMNPYLNTVLTLPAAVLGGFLLNRLVEQPLGRRFGQHPEKKK